LAEAAADCVGDLRHGDGFVVKDIVLECLGALSEL
jgi:hypothetical protein